MDRNLKIAVAVIGLVIYWNGRLLKKVIKANNHNAEMIDRLFANDKILAQYNVDQEFERIINDFDM